MSITALLYIFLLIVNYYNYYGNYYYYYYYYSYLIYHLQHWPEIRAVILVVSDKEKDMSSTSGMETSRLTSSLLGFRAASVVQQVCVCVLCI